MSNIVSDSPARTALPNVPCPEWCVTDHSGDAGHLSEPGYVIVHEGERQTFGGCQVAFGDDDPQVVSLFQTLQTLADGTEVEYGMVMNGRFLDVEGMEALVAGVQGTNGRPV